LDLLGCCGNLSELFELIDLLFQLVDFLRYSYPFSSIDDRHNLLNWAEFEQIGCELFSRGLRGEVLNDDSVGTSQRKLLFEDYLLD
jgi:hypothetical protein